MRKFFPENARGAPARADANLAADAPRVNANRVKNATRQGASAAFYPKLKYRRRNRAELPRALDSKRWRAWRFKDLCAVGCHGK
jgi:hypothetical protein